MKRPVLFFRIAAGLCFLAVALGVFGAHSLKTTLQNHGTVDVWNKGVFYDFLHAIALLILALHFTSRVTYFLLFGGIFFFSGSLYLLALTHVRWLVLAPPR
jgi:uncharacterized membrane protein YgdD (TMEM256/DUF423 family)